jgi:hypothetical protein
MSRRPLFPPVFRPDVSHRMVDDFTLRAARQRERQQPAGVGQTYVVPIRNHPLWSGNNELGRETDFAADSNNRQTVIKLEEWGAPEVWSVMLGLRFSDDFISGTNGFAIRAHIETGVGGAVQQFDVDWLQGASFSAVMNAITVIAEYDDATDVPPDLQLIATVARGKLSNTLPTNSVIVDVPGGTNVTVPIPKFSRAVTIYDTNNAGPSVYAASTRFTFNSAQGGGAQAYMRGDDLLVLGGRLLVPNGARFFDVLNGGAVPPAPFLSAKCIFELGL